MDWDLREFTPRKLFMEYESKWFSNTVCQRHPAHLSQSNVSRGVATYNTINIFFSYSWYDIRKEGDCTIWQEDK